jgi:hypothetical protein
VILYRCFAWNVDAAQTDRDGPLWFPRMFQGEGRHDNPEQFGCLYVAERSASAVAETLVQFRGHPLSRQFLRRRELPLALAAIDLPPDLHLVDLDDPDVLRREQLRPSTVATRSRDITQPQARALYQRHPAAAGLRWWSTLEATWINCTLFDRAVGRLRVGDVRTLTIDDPAVVEAADILGLG